MMVWFKNVEAKLEQQKEEGNMYISLMERKGMQKGIQEGMQKGIEEGMQKGRREERITLAVSMFREGIPLPTIEKITGFSEEEIREFARQEAN
ncbi:MAG TPA: hypothetical protein PLW97_12245 [Synergistaceae bacterium]|nr:hypothetical protein [Synergistaceae bacterium]HPQ38404.1 hypothetical protein [Synergistaceae bacterium]